VAKEFLDTPQISATVEHVCCEGMSYAMKSEILEQMGFQLMFLHYFE